MGVVVAVTCRHVMQSSPGAQVAPAEIRDVHVYVICLFQDAVVDGNIGTKGEAGINKLFLSGSVKQLFSFVKLLNNIRKLFFKCIDNAVHIPEKNARVPHKLATV